MELSSLFFFTVVHIFHVFFFGDISLEASEWAAADLILRDGVAHEHSVNLSCTADWRFSGDPMTHECAEI